jgi:two-component system sensor histidine kinase TtrS
MKILRAFIAAAAAFAAGICAAAELDALSAASGKSDAGAGAVHISVMDTLMTPADAGSVADWQDSFSNFLEKHYRIAWSSVVASDAASVLKREKPDFLILSASQILTLRHEGVPAYLIAARRPSYAKNAAEAVGSLFVTRADRSDIRGVADLRGKHVAAVQETSLSGYLAGLGEIAEQGFNPDRFFGRTSFLYSSFPEVVSSVLSGNTDAAILPTCLYESLRSRGLIDAAMLKPVGARNDGKLACLHSTALYPDVSIVSFEWTPESLERRMAVTLLEQPGSQGYEWLSTVKASNLEKLYQTLGIGPYSYLRDMTPAGIYRRWKSEINTGLLILALLLFNEFRLRRLVRRRTGQLSKALSQLQDAEREARKVREQLGSLERKNIVTQMSGMIAHEIRSPIGAIRNFAAALRIILKKPLAESEMARTALDGIDAEAVRVAGIVDRVRGYVKNKRTRHVLLDLRDAVKAGMRAYSLSSAASVPAKMKLPEAPAMVLGDSLELELLVLNLMKNGAEAVSGVKDRRGRPAGEVSVRLAPEESGAQKKWVLEVSDNGPALSEEEAKRLGESMESVKPEGLGLGLSIVRGIVDSHGASLSFLSGKKGGVTVRVVFDEAAAPAAAPEGDEK